MALNIKVNLDNHYELQSTDDDFRYSIFESTLTDGKVSRLGVKISSEQHPFMPDVYNLAFGPVNEKNEIDDRIKLTHQDHSKVFSTIVLAGLTFLTKHKDKYLGIDGSDTRRAYMYYRCIQNNFEYLNSLFTVYGVNYYLRILRDESTDYNQKDFLAIPKVIEKGETLPPTKLYNYFIFNTKQCAQETTVI
ncbi:MAG: hypothetical protein J7621_23120 [Niastella sp.]|nr:hypothetical protein [Niastella sp.]